MKTENYMNLEFPSKSANESFARAAIACFAAQLDPTLDEVGDIKTAVSEAVTNCIVHAYPDSIGPVILRAKILSGNVLDIVIKDRGRGIEDIEQARKPMFTTGGEERSGMGITIMESFMTEFSISSKEGKGTSIHMKRKIVRRGGKK
ncbi:MAG: anti-sigma F factor [Oscillospiraceae bacterium]|jgi:stage II sporulation protein AB (anti-sigma F factor)|nr:anti-sigma F factor [Oscillospiraceae bacterium]